jgi:hypothetical protein
MAMLLNDDATPQVDNVAPFERISVTEEIHQVVEPAIKTESNIEFVERGFVEKRQDKTGTELEIAEEPRALDLQVHKQQIVETAMREMNIDSEYRRESDEMAIEEDEHTHSTRDSRSPSVIHPSPIPVPGETYHSPTPRQLTFGESTKTPKISSARGTPSLLSLEERISHTVDNPFNHDSMIIDSSHISNPFLGEKTLRTPPRGPALLISKQENSQTHRPTHGLSTPATVLLTNSYDEWSNFCVGLGGDGKIDLVDSRLHGRAKAPIVWSNEYTASCAINGAWISPGELALVHKDARRNDDRCQITLIKYAETQSSTKPAIINLTRSPHPLRNKITAIAPLWVIAGRRTFATGGNSTLMNKIQNRHLRSIILMVIN